MLRRDGRENCELRKVNIHRRFLRQVPGSVLIEIGLTKVICTATLEDRVPTFLKGTNQGWIRGEYSMIPCSSPQRIPREQGRGISGRTHEIQRLIGRALRAIFDLNTLGERTIIIDCDVIQADGGTRCASITGGYVALVDLIAQLMKEGVIQEHSIKDYVAATSVGIIDGEYLLDLNYEEDSAASCDFNVVMTGSSEFIEIQGTAERNPFSMEELNSLIDLAKAGISKLINIQKEILGDI
ncbi:MAG: ribonuclease PH [bacterium]|nr:ribonuclease PH [bacterium]